MRGSGSARETSQSRSPRCSFPYDRRTPERVQAYSVGRSKQRKQVQQCVGVAVDQLANEQSTTFNLSKNPKRRRQRRSSTNPSSINDNDINDLSFSLYLSLSNQQLKYSGGSVGTGVAHTTDHKYDTGTIKLDDERNESESCECLSYATHHPKAPALHLAFGQLPPSS
jgi:hypothetical protein